MAIPHQHASADTRPPSPPPGSNRNAAGKVRSARILMLLENDSCPEDTRVVQEARSLCNAGYEVTVICPTGDSSKVHERVDRIRIYRYPKPPTMHGFVGYFIEYGYSMAAMAVFSLYVLFRHGFDAVHVHSPPDMNALIARFYQLLGKRFVLDTHDLSPELYQAQRDGTGNSIVHRALLWFERFACRSADRLIATNESQRHVQITRSGVEPWRCHVVRNGPAAKFLDPVEGSPEYAKSGKTIIGYVGMIGIQDGLDCLMRTLARLRYDLGQEHFLAVVVGSGPALEEIRNLAEQLELNDCVHFAGYITGDDLLRHIASFDICVTPDPSNPYNDSCTTIKTMEYMAMGKPTVAFDLPENRRTAGNSALYATGNDELELAKKLLELMDNPERRTALGRIARERVEKQFMWDMQAPGLLKVYQDLFARKRVGSPTSTVENPVAAPLVARSERTLA